MTPDHHIVRIAGVERALPLLQIAPGKYIAILNILGDVDLSRAAAVALADKLAAVRFEALVTPETKSIPLAHELAAHMDKPYVVLRKYYKPYMGDAPSATTRSITTGDEQTLYLDGRDAERIRGRRIVLVDDVISTGSTLQAMHALMEKADAEIVAEAAIFTEGEHAAWQHIVALGHLPIFGAGEATAKTTRKQ